MKKIIYALSAIALVAASSCVKEEMMKTSEPRGEMRTFTVSFDEDSQTRTDITKQGKTVWATGDSILVTNGTERDTLGVPSSAAGQKYFEFETDLEGTLYVVYPARAAVGMTEDNKFVLDMPRIQDGTFGSANISCAVAEDRYVKMRNVTSVLKFRVPSAATTPIKVVSINSVGNKMTGTFTVDLSSGTPVVSTMEDAAYSTDVTVSVDGNAGSNFYATVIPGTYTKGFSMTAVALDLDHAFESRTTVSDKELGVNELFDLGNIGTNLKPLNGNGTEGDPYTITNFPEYLVFTYYVNEGNSMKEKYVKVTADIAGITIPVGEGKADFQGSFDGGNHTFTVNLKEGQNKALGMFSYVGDSASIRNVKVAGNIEFGGVTGSIAGYVSGGDQGVTIENCSSSAMMKVGRYSGGIVGQNTSTVAKTNINIIGCEFSGAIEASGERVGGIVGWPQYCLIKNCKNSGTLEGTHTIGGIAGYAYMGTISGCTNTGAVNSTVNSGGFMAYNAGGRVYAGGSAGISSYVQNVTIRNCTNEGAISGVNKNGGIAGTMYWGTIHSCVNRGSVHSSSQAVGGILAYNFYQGTIAKCENYGEITTDNIQAGGIVGHANSYPSGAIGVHMCKNGGKVTAKSAQAGGIVAYTMNNNNVAKLVVDRCENLKDADVTATTNVGGILGCQDSYYNWCRADIMNCENHATVTATAQGAVLGGIFGGMLRNAAKNQGVMIYNSYNDGDVLYSAYTGTPAIGGIAGRLYSGEVWNCYNGGRVGKEDATMSPTAADTTYCGALVGYAAENNTFHVRVSGYYLDGTAALGVGKSAKIVDNGHCAADAEGALAAPVTIGSSSYANLVEALNAGVAAANRLSTCYSWIAGPEFGGSLITDPGDGGGFDIGDGGEI